MDFANFAQKQFFMQNKVRSVDLDEEERALVNFEAWDHDSLRVIASIPVGTELYRYMMENYKEQSRKRSEIAQVIQE